MYYKIQDGVTLKEINGEIVLYDARTEKIHCFNQTGTYIINLICREKYNISQVMSKIKVDFTDDIDDKEDQVRNFIELLISQMIISECE